eukprot:CAMPEP_0114312310 /NCGR_PEP_ID=MMETSP0059-20121206/20358_1 /TAXON_ID=36894 /ORGANISM="Pyramimonas parkeae, Strain CCMP726" /LENGTH=330 /DNA_ID=CAMNT_0001436679 /DNA_START=49 /DNA_END=1041 /DNA_ORIENTATION=+
MTTRSSTTCLSSRIVNNLVPKHISLMNRSVCRYDIRVRAMTVEEERVVQRGDLIKVHFKGTIPEDGTVFENTQEEGKKAISFKAGEGTVMPGLDNAVLGMKAGESATITLQPAEAFGEYDEEYLLEVPRNKVPDGVELGQHVLLMGNATARCVAVNDENYYLDMNHELAGKVVSIDVTVVSAVDPAHRFPLTKTDEEWKAQLDDFEFAVLRQKGTEPAKSGTYDEFFPETGYFVCKACDQPLYSNAAKFNSGCGWPAFDKCFTDSVAIEIDNSLGQARVEIMCSNCGGHLGHVFKGEEMTPSNERHCVNSVSVKFVDEPIPESFTQEKVV